MIHTRGSLVLVSLSVAVLGLPVGQAESISPVESITAGSIRQHVYFLASDWLEGRYTGSAGYLVAAQYGESQFRAAGLKPIVPCGEELGYLQSVPVVTRTAEAEPEMVIRTPKGETRFLHREDFRWLDGELFSCEDRALPVVFVGHGIHEPAAGWDDFAGLDVRNKFIIMLHGAPHENGNPVLPEALHAKYSSESSWQAKVSAMMLMPVAGILIPAPESMLQTWEDIPVQTSTPQLALSDRGADAWNIASLFLVKPEVVETIFEAQEQTLPGPDAKDTIVKGFALEGASVLVNTSFRDDQVPAWNVVGLVEGTDPDLKNEYVAVTAHLDHLPPNDEGEIRNGADDNASGCAGVMEIAEAVARQPFGRSVVFVLLAGEETMAFGSRYFVSACPIPRDKIVADINLDMIGRTDEQCAPDRAHYALDSDNLRPELKKLIMDVNDRTVRWPLRYVCEPDNASDNAVFELMDKIPGVFFYSGNHPDHNQPTDDAEKIDYNKAEKISRLGYEITKELATRAKLWD